jgi:flagellar biosynthesis/type III secretory pathway protein FliH
VAEGHKRRTLQKSDVAAAIAFSDVFDFLIDIVPRDGDEQATSTAQQQQASNPASNSGSAPPSTAATVAQAQVPQAQALAQAQHTARHFEDEQHWQPAEGEYDGYNEGRDGEALYSEYVQGEGEAFA